MNYDSFFTSLIDSALKRLALAKGENFDPSKYFSGCSKKQIDEFEALILKKNRFPAAYVSFLKLMGDRSMGIDNAAYADIESLSYVFQNELDDVIGSILAQNTLKDSEVCIFSVDSSGYDYFFYLPCEDDPPVYEYDESNDSIRLVKDSFTGLVKSRILYALRDYDPVPDENLLDP